MCYYYFLNLATIHTLNRCHKTWQLTPTVELAWRSFFCWVQWLLHQTSITGASETSAAPNESGGRAPNRRCMERRWLTLRQPRLLEIARGWRSLMHLITVCAPTCVMHACERESGREWDHFSQSSQRPDRARRLVRQQEGLAAGWKSSLTHNPPGL
jgi:hypothetical protein